MTALRPGTWTLASMAPLAIWAVQFGFIYGFTALACARGFADAEVLGFGVVPFAILAATVVALGGAGAFLVLAWRESRAAAGNRVPSTVGFFAHVAVVLAALSLAAIAWNGLPALFVAACA
jgi:hypothetical protein